MLVTAFMDIASTRPLSLFVEQGKLLFAVPVAKVAFIDTRHLDSFAANEWTTIVPFDIGDVLKEDNLELPAARTVQKDTVWYMELMNFKTHFVEKATVLFPAEDQFTWVDIGIFNIFKGDVELLNTSVLHLARTHHEGLRIGTIWNPTRKVGDIMEQIWWFFAGGVFGGKREAILKFHEMCKDVYRDITKEGKICWEVNIWYVVYQMDSTYFDGYECVHDASLLVNY